jgi:alkanesulfonate monooxygenase SsuD/methylene tetrahydromethanopterin reductase-like flavin-dependent oxidoreductase (luciferase family)
VLIVPYRNPISTAKMPATIDRMSGGRLIAGVGAGWNEAEFNALEVTFRERGARTTEYLRVWQVCWAPGNVSFAGRFVTFADMHVSPKPLQQSHAPIWGGGSSDAALRRAAAIGAVWQPTLTPIADLVERQAALRKACDLIGRQPPPETRHAHRGRRSITLPRGSGSECLSDQLSWQPRSWPAPRCDGLLHAGS